MSGERTVGFVGLGMLGQPMAAAIARAGHPLRVYNRTAEKARPLEELGAVRVETPGEVATQGGLVITMVADDRALEEVTTGEQGFLGRLGAGGVHLSMSTVSPEVARRLAGLHAERGESYLAAPVFGRPDAAAAGRLRICVAGPGAAKEQAMPVLRAMGQEIFDFGERPEAANVVKLSGNFLIAAAIEAMAEAFTLSEKNGVPRQAVHDFLSQTLFACPIYQSYGQAIAEQRYSPAGFRLPLGLKDMLLFLRTGEQSQVPTPLAGLVRDRLLASMAKGREDLDWTGLALEASADAGL